jgi:hypothetical protein
LRREAHGGFGERSGETDREQSRHRAPGLLSARLRHATPDRRPGCKQDRESVERECVIKTGTTTRTTAGGRWACWPTPGGGLPRSFGRKPYGRAAAARSAGPHPQAGR